jgi:hypothetical protein
MSFTHYDLGQKNGGNTVEVTLQGTEANVLLLDDSNFNAYRNGRKCNYWGGHYKRSPARISIPHAAHWHVVVDLGGYRGSVESSLRIY